LEPDVRRFNPAAETYLTERCFINELSNRASDPEISIARARVRPGVTTQWHALNAIVERYVILEGEGVVEIGLVGPQPVGPGDVVVIPAQCRQRITNTGPTDLVFLAICTPRFRHDTYQNLEDPLDK
jgi:mannose-6-phosphate isomerase-like protein (cupin superfamily)